MWRYCRRNSLHKDKHGGQSGHVRERFEMGKKKKQFIDKKSAHSFQLVHRSQKDPLQADEESSKHVLLPVDGGDSQGATETDSIAGDKRRKKEEEEQHGIFFDDDYDYLQHVKPRTNMSLEPLPEHVTVIEAKKPLPADHLEFGSVKLPSEAFASTYEQDEGLLNLAAPTSGPRPDLDPDIVAALDDALDLDDPDNILDDDFILKANKESADYESDDDLIRSDDDDEDDDLFPSDEAEESDDGMSFFEEEETKSRFTNYSMTSSVLRRNEGLKLIDDRFEKVMEEYDEDEIGALDHEELEGTVGPDSERLNALADEFIESQQNQDLPKVEESEAGVKCDNDDDSESLSDELIKITEEPKEKWDCESILSTYSNLYNHPTLIKDSPKVKPIKLSKAGIPLGVFSQGDSRKTVKPSEDMNGEETHTHIPRNATRNRDETKEEKKQRKQEIKNDRKVRRMEKKANKIAFKSEKQRQEQSLMNTKQQQGKKL